MNITNTLLFFVEKILTNNSVFAYVMYVVSIYLTSGVLNDEVKLTKF